MNRVGEIFLLILNARSFFFSVIARVSAGTPAHAGKENNVGYMNNVRPGSFRAGISAGLYAGHSVTVPRDALSKKRLKDAVPARY
jgi:hypothetical protein